MDTDKWKSVLVPKEVYEEIKLRSKQEGRTISGQLRIMFSTYKEQESLKRQVAEKKKAEAAKAKQINNKKKGGK